MQTHEKQEVERRPRRVWWIIGLTVLVLTVIGFTEDGTFVGMGGDTVTGRDR